MANKKLTDYLLPYVKANAAAVAAGLCMTEDQARDVEILNNMKPISTKQAVAIATATGADAYVIMDLQLKDTLSELEYASPALQSKKAAKASKAERTPAKPAESPSKGCMAVAGRKVGGSRYLD